MRGNSALTELKFVVALAADDISVANNNVVTACRWPGQLAGLCQYNESLFPNDCDYSM
jgi:hypothetical protein